MLFNSKKKGGGPPSGGAAREPKKSAQGKASAERRSQPNQAPARQSGVPETRALVRGSDPAGLSSTLNSHLVFEGDLRYSGTVLVDCEFNGSIFTDDTLLVGESGRVQAEINAGVVEISGKVNGNIKAVNRVKILSGGEVRGNIETPSISMEEGVLFEGNCTRARPQSSESQSQRPVQQPSRREQPSVSSPSASFSPSASSSSSSPLASSSPSSSPSISSASSGAAVGEKKKQPQKESVPA